MATINTHINQMQGMMLTSMSLLTNSQVNNQANSQAAQAGNLLETAEAAIKAASPRLFSLLRLFLTLAVGISLVVDYDFLLSNPWGDPNLRMTAQTALTIFLRLLSGNVRYAAIGKT
jgi:hypothetical protein